jgi:hypothetical protein
MNSFPVAKFLRNGTRFFFWLSLPFALLGVTTALYWAPEAKAEDLVLVVGIPLGLFVLGARIVMMIKPQREFPDDRPAAKAYAMVFRAVPALAVLLLATIVILLGFATLAALPFYFLLEIDWAPAFGLIAAALLVIFGVGAFVIALIMISPRLFKAIVRTGMRRAGTPAAAIRSFFVSSH